VIHQIALSSQEAFCNAIECSRASLVAFQRHSGVDGGAGSVVYLRAYPFFEKMRIVEGGKKGKKRLDAEQFVPGGYAKSTPRTFGRVQQGSNLVYSFEHGVRKMQVVPE
jgi:hypothetical protein